QPRGLHPRRHVRRTAGRAPGARSAPRGGAPARPRADRRARAALAVGGSRRSLLNAGALRLAGSNTRSLVVTPFCQNGAMADQLHLIEPDDPEWRLDERTRDTGRKGVEAARQALRDAASAAPPVAARDRRLGW